MTAEEFFKLFGLKKEDYIKEYLWNSDRATGFTILKTYPKTKFFQPAVTITGADDTLAMVKVYVTPKENSAIWPVGSTTTKISLYGLDKSPFQEENNDPNAPTKESSEKSSASFLQPINLEEENRYTFNSKEQTFFDIKRKQSITANSLVELVYQDHISTYTSSRGYLLQGKFFLHRLRMKLTEWLGKVFVIIIPTISGRKIDNEAYNLLFRPFPWVKKEGIKDKPVGTELEDYENLIKKINPLTFSFLTGFLLILYWVYYNFCSDFLGIISFIKANKEDQIFSVTLIAFIVLFFNYILPNVLLFMLNVLVKIYAKLSVKRYEL